MAFSTEQTNTPTDIGKIKITLSDTDRIDKDEDILVDAYDTPVQLTENKIKTGTLVLSYTDETDQTTVYVENTDYTVDHANGTVTALDTGSMELDLTYDVSYKYTVQNAYFILQILDQDGEIMVRRNGDLAPHITTQERTNLIAFLDTLRARAVTQIIG